MEKPKNITEYIQSAPEADQQKLWELLEILHKASPDAEESLKWGQPALSYEWILYQFAAFQHHISLYPHPNVVKAFQDRLTEYKTSSSTIQFPLDKPLPVDLIFEIAAYRVKESTENGIKWK